MLDGHKIVCVTPAGRRRYLRLLIPYVLACPQVDRYDLWVNTPDEADLAFMQAVAQIDDRIRLVPLPAGRKPDAMSIHAFWPGAADTGTVYVRFDDDVVWIDPRFFDTLLRFRLDHPEYFLIAPLIINNAMSSFLLQTFRKITTPRLLSPDRFDTVGWVNPNFARSLHELLQTLVANGEVEKLNCGRIPLSGNIFSINCISWFGRDFAPFGGKVPEDEEPAVSCTISLRAGRLNAMETGAVVAHLAFFTQRETIDRSGVLEGYLRLAAERAELEPWRSRVEAVYAKLEERFPVHLSVGGAPPRKERRPSLLKRLFPPKQTERSSNKKDDIRIERGPAL
ncbi:MAG: hypothetical protein AB7F74_17905 [Parvibaculaceae bacterium]